MEKTKKNFKQKVVSELYRFAFYTLFFTFFFWSFSTYNLILGEHTVTLLNYGYGFFESLILAKIILLGETLKLGEKFASRSLIIPTLYKSLVFTLFVIGFMILEHFVTGSIRGKEASEIYQELLSKGIDVIAAKIQVMYFVFILFFAFLEIGRVLGENKLFNLFFRREMNENAHLPKRHD